MITSIYQSAKIELKQTAKEAKQQFKNDLPAIRQTINDEADNLCKTFHFSEHQRNLLSNFACTLHPLKKLL